MDLKVKADYFHKAIKSRRDYNDEKEICNDIEIETYKHPDDLPSPEEINPRKNPKKVLIVVDDSMLLSQAKIEQLFTHGRPNNINTIFITQAFNKMEKSTIRLQTNFYICFPPGEDLKIMYDSLFNSAFKSRKDFLNYSKDVWKNKDGHITINLDSNECTKNFQGSDFHINEFNTINNMKSDINEMKSGGTISLEEYNNQILKASKSNKLLQNKIQENILLTKGIDDISDQWNKSQNKKQEAGTNKIVEAINKSKGPLQIGYRNNANNVVGDEPISFAHDQQLVDGQSETNLQEICVELLRVQDDFLFGPVKFGRNDYYQLGVIKMRSESYVNESTKKCFY